MINERLLKTVGASFENAALYAPILRRLVIVHGDAYNSITSKTGCCMLVAQMAHESGGFSAMVENLNYQVQALLANPRFTEDQARRFGSDQKTGQPANQEAIANVMYGGRMGNTQPGDGWRFRGAGPLQLTGRDNFTDWGRSIGMSAEDAAVYARTPDGGIAAALWYWRDRGLINPAYRGDVSTCTRIINGAYHGLADRVARYKNALAAWSVA